MNGTLAIVAAIAGQTINKTITKTGDSALALSVALPAAKVGTLGTRTDNDTGVITLSGGHGIVNGKVDVHWSSGGVNYCRYGMDATVAANDVTVDGGAGDNLPAEDASVNVAQQLTINAAIDGDEVELVALNCSEVGHVDLQDVSNASIEAITLNDDEPWTWWNGSGVANPLTGNPITNIEASNGSTTAATLTILVLQDGTP